jgi:hypothetical protein
MPTNEELRDTEAKTYERRMAGKSYGKLFPSDETAAAEKRGAARADRDKAEIKASSTERAAREKLEKQVKQKQS